MVDGAGEALGVFVEIVGHTDDRSPARRGLGEDPSPGIGRHGAGWSSG